MQVYLKNATGMHLLPSENEKLDLSQYNNLILIRLGDKEEATVDVNNNKNSLSGPLDYEIPIIWDRLNKCNVVIRQKAEMRKYTFQLDNIALCSEEDISNLLKFVGQLEDNFMIGHTYKIEDLFQAIKEDKVSLIIEKTPYVGYDDQSLLRKIADTVPMVMDICSHPKQSLRTEEAVLDVNLVKRINSRTMDHLSSHSEHWKARTLNGLIPNRLRADIFDDDINIYENLFFRMAVDDILKYVHKQTTSIEGTVEQNDNAIDWNAYGEALYDYKRMRVFEQLLPNYNVAERQNENKKLRALYNQWERLEKNFSTVEASQFYRSIDSKRHISRNIKPTNIIKKDSRYNALYRLWCEIQRQKVQEQQESSNVYGTEYISLSDSYSMYVAVMILYSFKLLECELDDESSFSMKPNGDFVVDAIFRSKAMTYAVQSSKNQYGTMSISIDFSERKDYVFAIPYDVQPYIDEIAQVLPKEAELTRNGSSIIFHSRLSAEKQKELKNLFHMNQAVQKSMPEKEREQKKQADKVWRPMLEEFFMSSMVNELRSEKIYILPQFANVEKTESTIDKYTQSTFDTAENKTVFTLPIDIRSYRKTVKSERIIVRLLNYGEKYFEEDASLWGDYRVGLLPVAQSEINSAQRLMKLISLHSSRLLIQWNTDNKFCPICGQGGCQNESANNWKCTNPDCGVIFGKTKHANGCGQDYEWTRPFVDIKRKDIKSPDKIEYMLKKETIFDRLAITDFEFEDRSDGTVKYLPVCPKCGKKNAYK